MKLFSTVTAVAFLGSIACAQESGDPAMGQTLAEENCVQCHNIASGGAFKLYPPSFSAIAAYMDPDIIRMKIMYPDHVVIMPQFHTYMTLKNLNDLVSYIATLEQG